MWRRRAALYAVRVSDPADPAPPAPEPARPTASAGAPASLGEFAALGGTTSEDVVRRMQERAGNQATTSWLASAVRAEAVPPPHPEEERPT